MSPRFLSSVGLLPRHRGRCSPPITDEERARREEAKIRLGEPMPTRPRGNPLLALAVIEQWQRQS